MANTTSTEHGLSDGRHHWTRRLEGVDDPATDIKVQVHDGRLLISVKGQQIDNLELPPTAYTGGDAHASYQRGLLRVEMACKDPAAPAMVEKALMDPDRPHPRELPLQLMGSGRGATAGIPNKEDPIGRHAPTPAQAEYGERNPELFGRPHVHAVMPEANIASTVASDMPVLTNPGAAIEAAADNGETVVVDPRSSDTKIYVPHVDQLAERLGRAELAPPGTTVVRGSRDKAVEAEYGAGDDAEQGGDQFTRKTVDFVEEKVGMATRPLEARDFYATAESGSEPYSSLKAQNDQDGVACDMCQCAPCQCDKMAKGFPYELTPQEQKRSGKPSLHNARKPVTGTNAHPARDFKLHSKVRSEEHGQVGFRTREYVGDVPQQGTGSLDDLPATQRDQIQNKVVGGREIDPELIRDRTRTAEVGRHFLG